MTEFIGKDFLLDTECAKKQLLSCVSTRESSKTKPGQIKLRDYQEEAIQAWINNNLGETTNTNAFDLKLVDKLDHIKYTDKMLLVIHLMGNHGSYAQRYPKNFSKFGNKKTIDHYDNSMLYNDYVVSRIYEKVKKIPYFQAMIYCADHADAVDQNLAHDASRFVWAMTEVPMYMIFSESFAIRNKSIIDNLRIAEDKMFTNDLLYNLLNKSVK